MGKQSNKDQYIKTSDGRYSKQTVSFIIAANVIFTIAVLIIFLITGSEPSTMIGAWFAFTTVELWSLAKIKTKKEETKQKEIIYGNDSSCG